MSLELGLVILGGLGGAYGSIQSFLTQRKMKQVEVERLTTRLDIDFHYSTISTPDYNLLHGTVSFENKGETNLKIIRLNIDGRDRSPEFTKSYNQNRSGASTNFVPLQEQVTSLNIVALNNYKQVYFSNSSTEKEFRIFKPDLIYAREIGQKIREVEDVKGNINAYIREKIEQLRFILEKKAAANIEQELHNFLFLEMINKELRGLQIFPNAVLNQEFFVKYSGTGVVYLNVETSTIRFLQETIKDVEQYKVLADYIIRTKKLDEELIEQLTTTIRRIVMPESQDIHKQKESFLVYLS